MTPQMASKVFAALIAVVAAFHLALALGMPWGQFAMGGAFPGAYSLTMRAAEVAQIVVLAFFALVLLSRAGLVLPALRGVSRRLVWVVVGILGISLLLNLITPSPLERLIWAPVALGLFATALRVAVSR